jgi:arylsulfatase A-like enzyme
VTQARLLRHGYYACVSYVDAQIGRLLDQLEKLGIANDTIVILWGDHGWKLGEHRSWCKMTNYETDTRAPLIIRAPGAKENGRQCAALVEFVDVYPTLCELAGIKAPDDVEGTSFAPLLTDRRQPWKKAVFSQFMRYGKWAGPDGVTHMGYTIRTPKWRYVEWYGWDRENEKRLDLVGRELYDEEADPQENLNLIDRPEYKKIVEQLAEQLKAGGTAARP